MRVIIPIKRALPKDGKTSIDNKRDFADLFNYLLLEVVVTVQ